MVFDGHDWNDAQLCYPVLAHPRAPLTGPSLSRVQKASFVHARYARTLIFDVYPSFDWTHPTTTIETLGMFAASYARIAEGFRELPLETTHLVAEVTCSLLQANDQVRIYHKLSVTDGTHTDVGAEVLIEGGVTTTATSLAALLRRDPSHISPFGDSEGTFRVRPELALSTVTTGAIREVFCEAYAIDKRSGAALSYWRQRVAVWAEYREA